jgi:hypothetical protein
MAEIPVKGAERKQQRRAGRAASAATKKNNGAVAGAGAGKPGKEPESGKTENPSNAAAEPEKKEPEKKERGNGLKKLQKAADQRLGRDSEALADLLLEKAKEGKVESARLLVTLAEHKKGRRPQEKKKKKRTGPSFAELLASEPEWVEEKPEVGDVWVGDGWKNEKTGRFVPAPR